MRDWSSDVCSSDLAKQSRAKPSPGVERISASQGLACPVSRGQAEYFLLNTKLFQLRKKESDAPRRPGPGTARAKVFPGQKYWQAGRRVEEIERSQNKSGEE